MELRPCEHPLRLRCFRDGDDDEICSWQHIQQGLRAVQFSQAGGWLRQARVHPQDRHAELGAQARGLAADAAHTDHHRRGLGQVDGGVALAPDSLNLLRDVDLQPAGEGQQQRHDMGADVVVVDLAGVGDHHLTVDKRLSIVPGPRAGLGTGDPAEFLRPRSSSSGTMSPKAASASPMTSIASPTVGQICTSISGISRRSSSGQCSW